jgi:hypothetical protein
MFSGEGAAAMTGPDTRPGFALGVDLGTSHTVAMLRWPDGRTRPVLFDGQPLLPSAVFLDTTGRLHVGRDALRLGHADPARFEPSPKRHIDDETVLLGGSGVPVADLLAALLGAVGRETVAAAGFLPPAVLTYPAAWGSRRRDVLIEAIARAGWPAATQLVPEPVAAARYFAEVLRRPVPVGSALAVFDFGGGTLDIAVVRNEGGGRFVVAASGGADDLGGLDLDAALVEHLGKSVAGAEPEAWATLTDPVTLAQWRARRQFWVDVCGAKEMLSRTVLAPVPIPGVEHAVQLTREEFEGTAGPLIRRGVAEAAAVIKASAVPADELAGLFLVGGSSRVPLVARLLHSELGVAPTVLEQPELPVAEGAILAATPNPAPSPVASASPSSPSGATPPPAASPVSPAETGAGPSATGDLTATAPHPAPSEASSTDAAGVADGAESARSAQGRGEPQVSQLERAGHGSVGPGAGTSAAGSPARPASAGSPVAASAGGAPEPGPVPDDPLRYRQGVAAAATPSPTADTEPRNPPPPPSSAPVSPAPHYAEPVDPWATAEAAALAAHAGGADYPGGSAAPFSTPPAAESWLASTDPDPRAGESEGASPGLLRRAYGKKGFWVVAAALVVVVGAAATLLVVFWPGYRALDFRAFDEIARIPPAVEVTSGFSDAAIIGDRAYFANADANGLLGVVAVGAHDGKKAWSKTTAGVATRWEKMVALPSGLAVFAATESATGKRRMAILGAKDGGLLWDRQIDDSDEVFFVGDVAVLVDRVEHRLLGLEINKQGHARWSLPDLKSTSGTGSAVVPVSTTADVSGPASAGGRAFEPDLDDDKRIVQISADRSARVIDAGTGEELVKPRQNVAAPGEEEIVAHNGRLFVRESDNGQRIVAYDLAKLGEPESLYTAPTADDKISSLVACGKERVCFLQSAGYDAKTTQVVAVDTDRRRWSTPLAQAETLVPVGDSVLVSQNSSPPRVSLLDRAGKASWGRDGEAARLDAGNVLLFNKAMSAYPDDPSLWGQHLGDGAVPLGPLSGVRSATCAWDTSAIACVAETDFVLQSFAG